MEFLLNPLISKEEWNEFVAKNGGPSSREATKGRGKPQKGSPHHSSSWQAAKYSGEGE